MNVNKVFLAGNLTRDPELKYSQNKTEICSFTIAISEKWSKEGQNKEETAYIDCTAFGGSGEAVSKYFKKGKPIFIEGKLRYHQWQDKDQKWHKRINVMVLSFQFVGPAKSDGKGDPEQGDAPSGEDIPF